MLIVLDYLGYLVYTFPFMKILTFKTGFEIIVTFNVFNKYHAKI